MESGLRKFGSKCERQRLAEIISECQGQDNVTNIVEMLTVTHKVTQAANDTVTLIISLARVT